MQCFPVLPSTWKKGTSERVGQVTFMTWAPYSARVRPMAGPAMMRHSSRTRMPDRGWGFEEGIPEAVCGGKGAGGELSLSLVSSTGGFERSVLP